MNIKLNCSQVETLINFYVEGKLAPSLRDAVDNHILKCQKCRKKIQALKDIFYESNLEYKNIEKVNYDNEFLKNLSAYIDNELDTLENVKIKKVTISNPSARKKLETMYNYQKLMFLAYEKTKNNIKFDYSKNIISMINESNAYTTSYFKNITIMFFLILIGVICGFVYLYF